MSRIVVAEFIRRDRFFSGGETQRKEMRKGCDLPASDPFILSLNLIGVAQLAPHVAHQIVRADNRDFLCCCFIKKSKGLYVCRLKSITRLWLNSTKWQLACDGTRHFRSRLTGIQSIRRRGTFVNSKLPILFNVILSQLIVGFLKREQRRKPESLSRCLCAASSAGTRIHGVISGTGRWCCAALVITAAALQKAADIKAHAREHSRRQERPYMFKYTHIQYMHTQTSSVQSTFLL